MGKDVVKIGDVFLAVADFVLSIPEYLGKGEK